MFNRVMQRIWFVAGLGVVLVLGAVETAAAQIPPDPGGPVGPPPAAAASSTSAWWWVLLGVGIVVAAALVLWVAVTVLRRYRHATTLRPRLP